MDVIANPSSTINLTQRTAATGSENGSNLSHIDNELVTVQSRPVSEIDNVYQINHYPVFYW